MLSINCTSKTNHGMQLGRLFFLLILSLCCINRISYAQDLHFSQYMKAPLLTNPANTGDIDSEWRFIHNFRSQWYSVSSPFSTYSLSFEKNMVRNQNQWGLGLNLLYDRSGIARLQIAKFNLSASYQRSYFRQSIRVGAQAGYNLYQYSLDHITTDSQWDQSLGYYNPSLGSGELLEGSSMGYLAVNLGLLYRYQSIAGFDHRLGFSVYNLTQSVAGFITPIKTPISFSSQYQLSIPFSARQRVKPNFMYRYQEKSSYLLAGAMYEYLTNPNSYQITALTTGLSLRSGFDRVTDALIVHGGLSFLQTEVGISYDINISNYSTATHYQGAFEIYIVYQASVKQAFPGAIPCSRQ